MGMYADSVVKGHACKTPSRIRAEKCARTKARNQQRSAEQIEKDKSRPKLSNVERLKVLDFRLGVGVGAKKERKRLLASS